MALKLTDLIALFTFVFGFFFEVAIFATFLSISLLFSNILFAVIFFRFLRAIVYILLRFYSSWASAGGVSLTRLCTSLTIRLVLELQQEIEQQQASRIGGLLKGIFIIMYAQIMRQTTVATYPPSSWSLSGSSEFGRRLAKGRPAETEPERVVNIVIGNVMISMVTITSQIISPGNVNMSLPRAKRQFIKELVSDIDGAMRTTQITNQIGIAPRNEIEIFIRDHFLVQNDDGTFNVNMFAFRTALDVLDFDILCEILIHLDRLGITLRAVCNQSRVKSNSIFADFKSFKDLILF